MPDLLTDTILPVMGLCPPGSLLIPWLMHARSASGRPLGLPERSRAATFAVAKRVTERLRQSRPMQAPVAAVLLDDEESAAHPMTLVMLDWRSELGPHSAVALRGADGKAIFGMDVAIGRRLLIAVTKDDALPAAMLRELCQHLALSMEDVGWLGLRSLNETLTDYLRRVPRDRYRAPERTAADLLSRLDKLRIRPFRPLPSPSEGVLAHLASSRSRKSWRYEALRRGTREFPWSFSASEAVESEAMVLDAQLWQRKEARSTARRSET